MFDSLKKSFLRALGTLGFVTSPASFTLDALLGVAHLFVSFLIFFLKDYDEQLRKKRKR